MFLVLPEESRRKMSQYQSDGELFVFEASYSLLSGSLTQTSEMSFRFL